MKAAIPPVGAQVPVILAPEHASSLMRIIEPSGQL